MSPSNEELLERIVALESREIKIKDLPLAALKKKLGEEPQNAADLLLPHSISPGLLTESTKIITGGVSAAGTVDFGEGFTVAHVATGEYHILFNEAFDSYPAVSGSDRQGTQRTFSHAIVTNREIVVNMSPSTGAKENIAFSFIAIG